MSTKPFPLPPVVLAYAALVVGVLLTAGLALMLARRLSGKPLEGVARRYRSWWVMAPAALTAVALGRVVFILAVTVLALAAFREFARATPLGRDRRLTTLVVLAILGTGACALVPQPGPQDGPGWYGLFAILPAYVITALLMVPVVRDRPAGTVGRLPLAVLAYLYLGWMFGHLAFLANARQGPGLVLFLIFAVELNDVAAFMFGSLFGRRRLRPRISPNKTVEGAAGALAVSMALPWVLAFSLPDFGWLERVLAGLIVGVGGQAGDLVMSAVKRDLGVKDLGETIPGHGGVLDRVDSLILTAPLFFHMVRWFQGIR